jgi:N-acetyl-gamma-glutamyl-phosphate reductase
MGYAEKDQQQINWSHGVMKMTKVGIIGASGYTGAELVRILSRHPKVEISVITSRQYAGQPLGDCYPGLAHLPLTFTSHEDDAVFSEADVFFTALPHKAAMEAVKRGLDRGKKVIDLSADFRLTNIEDYEEHYGPHSCPELLKEAVYGLSELYSDDIAKTRLVANPGCYPTSSLLPLMPLVKAGLVTVDDIIIDAKSGVSGAGRGASQGTHFCEVGEGFKAYKVASHRHTPEIEAQLALAAGRDVTLTFTPHLVPMSRGMLATIYVKPAAGVGRAEVEKCWGEVYANTPFVTVAQGDQLPDTAHVRGTNRCVMAVREDARTGRLIILSAIDNLAKGASAQAVQNLNIMMGWGEDLGVPQEPMFP